MAVNNERSMNNDLQLGTLDRSRHQVAPGRGGQVEMDWPLQRADQLMRGSWSPPYLEDAIKVMNDPTFLQGQMFDYCLRDQIEIVTGPTARTRRPTAHNQFEANPYPTPLDAVHTSWPDRWS